MSPSEASIIARKLRNYYIAQNLKAAPKPRADWVVDNTPVREEKVEPGFFAQGLMVTLMGTAVFLTELSLILIKWVRRLEQV